MNMSCINSLKSAKEKFITILSEIYKEKRDDFDLIFQPNGPIRTIDLSINNSEIVRFPEKIPNSPYWAETNYSTPQKAILIFKIMDKLGYDSETIVSIVRHLIR